LTPGDGSDIGLAQTLVLSQSRSRPLNLPRSALERFDPLDLGRRVARASQDAIVVAEGLELLSADEWSSLSRWANGSLRPDGVLVLRFAHSSPIEAHTLKRVLAESFGAVEMFSWDGVRRGTGQAGSADLFAICRAFLPYPGHPLELLRPRVVTAGPEWRSTWLCERPTLPDRFLLRATLDMLGANPGGIDLRLRFLTPGSARYRIEGHLKGAVSEPVELLLSSQLAKARGQPRWGEVERIAIDFRTESEEPVDVRVSDLRIFCTEDPPSSSVKRTSADLRDSYDEAYYKAMPGYADDGRERALRELVNVHRAYALMLSPAPDRAVDIGCARGDLAAHLIEHGTQMTLLDYSPTAIQLAKERVGEAHGTHFVVDEAANLSEHVAEGSQDVIYMTDFVEHLTVEELRPVLHACRRVLSSQGVLIIHTPERFSGAIATAKAIHGAHVNLFEIDTLDALLCEMFGAVDTFTWNGFECFLRCSRRTRPGEPPGCSSALTCLRASSSTQQSTSRRQTPKERCRSHFSTAMAGRWLAPSASSRS
jgi:2-polyprenyl-3-methyl-5-hydroxy-6-metoxy-1,4-benzoquinol methylase